MEHGSPYPYLIPPALLYAVKKARAEGIAHQLTLDAQQEPRWQLRLDSITGRTLNITMESDSRFLHATAIDSDTRQPVIDSECIVVTGSAVLRLYRVLDRDDISDSMRTKMWKVYENHHLTPHSSLVLAPITVSSEGDR